MLGQTYTLLDVKDPVVRALRLTAVADVALAVKRIDLWHRELCSLADWPALRQETLNVVPTAGIISLANALGVSGVERATGHVPAWYVDRVELSAGDLAERMVWTSDSVLSAGGFKIAAWKWDATASAHVAETVACNVRWWSAPATLTSDAQKLSLPGTRALLARTVCDLIGLMDKQEIDADPWRRELTAGLEELKSYNPEGMVRNLRLLSGRVLLRAPARVELAMPQPAPQQVVQSPSQ